jgi:hypothetical protein
MQRRHASQPPTTSHKHHDDRYDLDALLHPANAFAHPSDVVEDHDLTLSEKRAILASWASDACAFESAPLLRRPPGHRLVSFDDIIDALRELDQQGGKYHRLHYRQVLAERRPGMFGRKSQKPADGRRSSLN